MDEDDLIWWLAPVAVLSLVFTAWIYDRLRQRRRRARRRLRGESRWRITRS